MLLSLCLVVLTGGFSPWVCAGDERLADWRAKAAARFKGNPDEAARDKMLAAIPKEAPAKPASNRRILGFYRCEGFIHTSIPFGNFVLAEMGEKTGAYTMDLADEYDVFRPENLAKYDAILFNNTTNLEFPDEASKQALMEFVAAGKGVIGIHGASDNFKTWPEAAAMIGGVFNGHPWNANGRWAFELNDAEHPVNEAFDGRGFWHTDEIYWYRPDSFQGRDHLRILISLDMTTSKNLRVLLKSKKRPMSEDEARAQRVPVSWIREFRGGRVCYSNLGHRDDTFWNPTVLEHFLAGIQFALGDLPADATPTAEMSDLKLARAPEE